MQSKNKQTLLAVCFMHTEAQALVDFEREREFQRESVGMFCPSRCLNQTIKALQAVVSYNH